MLQCSKESRDLLRQAEAIEKQCGSAAACAQWVKAAVQLHMTRSATRAGTVLEGGAAANFFSGSGCHLPGMCFDSVYKVLEFRARGA